jgi:NAD(P)-dependent dehydrogenase (short-subunit alcohol dehydrogenase family)
MFMSIKAFDKFDLTGRTAVVTAGATGMGYYMARGLARSGAKVLIAQRRADVLATSAERLRNESGGEILTDTVDLRDRSSTAAFNQRALEKLGGSVDIFIGNAALDTWQHADKVTNEVIDSMFQVNVSSILEMIRDFLPGMRSKRWGRIILSSSTTTLAASPHEGMTVYAATKGALNSIAHTVATEVGHDGITCNSIVLGMYLTELLQAHLDAVKNTQGKEAVKAFNDAMASMTACGRVGRPDEVEGLIQLLASDAGAYITGANLCADGGLGVMLRPNPPPENPVYPPAF